MPSRLVAAVAMHQDVGPESGVVYETGRDLLGSTTDVAERGRFRRVAKIGGPQESGGGDGI